MNALIKIDGKAISKVGVKLIDKISAGIGGLYAPVGVVRMAKAKAEAKVIAAQADDRAFALQQRTIARVVSEEVRRQVNIEQIAEEAIKHLKEDAEPDAIDDDWMANFFDKAKLVSDSEMRELWSRILAAEANQPTSFSRRTVNLMADFDKADARAFAALCAFRTTLGNGELMILNPDTEVYKAAGLDFGTLTQLESLGLIRFDMLTGFGIKGFANPTFSFQAGGRTIEIALRGGVDQISIGNVIFTRSGRELSQLIEPVESPAFGQYVYDHYRALGMTLEAVTAPVGSSSDALSFTGSSFILEGGAIETK